MEKKTLTEEEVQILGDLEDNSIIFEEDKELLDEFSNKTLEELQSEPEVKMENVAVDEYGINHVVNDEFLELTASEQEKINKMVDKTLATGSETITEDQLRDSLIYHGYDEADVIALTKLADRYMKGEKFPIYNELPEKVKSDLNALIYANTTRRVSNAELRMAKNNLAKDLLNEMINSAKIDNTLDVMTKDLSEELDKDIKSFTDEQTRDYITNQRKSFEVDYLEKAKEAEENGEVDKAELLRKLSRAFTQSYTLTDMMEDMTNNYGKYRVKRIKLDKFYRECESFNIKYKNSQFIVKDLYSIIVPILLEYINTEDTNYDVLDVKKLLLAFMTYTLNMKPEVLDEHVFMCYFIGNISLLNNAVSDTDKEFTNELICNLRKVINLINIKEEERNEKANAFIKGSKSIV